MRPRPCLIPTRPASRASRPAQGQPATWPAADGHGKVAIVLFVTTVARIVLAGVFLVSAWGKIRDREGSRDAVAAFGVPASLVAAVASALPVVELACAALLLAPDPAATVGALASALLLAAFTVAIAANLARGRRPACHCFGAPRGDDAISGRTIVRNAGLLALAGLALLGAGNHLSIPAALAELSVPAVALVIGAGVSVLAVRGVRARRAPTRPAPVRLPDLVPPGRPAIVVFISPRCARCTDLLPDLSAWQGDPRHPVSVVVVSDGDPAEVRRKVADAGPLDVTVPGGPLPLADLGLAGTPAALLLDAEGNPSGAPAHGVEEVRALHAAAIGQARPGTPARGRPAATAPASAWDTPVVTASPTPARAAPQSGICSDSGDCPDA